MSPDSTMGRVLDREQSLALLATTDIGRIIFARSALPAVDLVTFVVDGSDVAIRTGGDARTIAVLANAIIAFQTDDFDRTDRLGWSVTVTGLATLVTSPADIDRLSPMLRPWGSAGGHSDRFLRIRADVVSGRCIGGPGQAS